MRFDRAQTLPGLYCHRGESASFHACRTQKAWNIVASHLTVGVGLLARAPTRPADAGSHTWRPRNSIDGERGRFAIFANLSDKGRQALLQDPRQQPPPHQQDLRASLRRPTSFGQFTDEQIQTLARRTHLVRLDAGETLFRRGEIAKALYLLVKGQLKRYRISADGDEGIIDLIEPSATFAESRVFLDNPRFHVSGQPAWRFGPRRCRGS